MTATATTRYTTDEDTTMTDSQRPTVAPLSTTATIPVFGTLVWLAPLWAVAALGNAVALWAIARWGSMDQSLWSNALAGWQRWPVAGAGFTMIAVFLPLFVTHGATRRRLAQSAFVAMGVFVAIGTAVITVGFALERIVYDRQDWVHAVESGGDRTISDIGLGAIATRKSYFPAGHGSRTSRLT